MNALKTLTATLLLMTATAAAAAAAPEHLGRRIIEVPDGPVDVKIWTDRGDGAKYCVGDSIEVWFRTDVDAWVAIYNVDTRGRVTRLFPTRRHKDHFVRGGRDYRVPNRRGHRFEVAGPTGWETLTIVASTDRRDVLESPYVHGRPAAYGFDRDDRYDGDRYDRRTDRSHAAGGSDAKVELYRDGRRIVEVPDDHGITAVDETRFRVRDGYRCSDRPHRPRPWWHRR